MKTYVHCCAHLKRNSVSWECHFPIHRSYWPAGSNSPPLPVSLSDDLSYNLPISPNKFLILNPDDEGRTFLRNVGAYLQDTVPQPRRPIIITDEETSKLIPRYVFVGAKSVFNKYSRSWLLSNRSIPRAFCWTVKSGLSKRVKKYPSIFLYECFDWKIRCKAQEIGIYSTSAFHGIHLARLKKENRNTFVRMLKHLHSY
jgi:hypothetical protein